MVKAELGLDAMILSSKKERRKGLLGYFLKPYYEVTAALDPRPTPQVRPNPYREEPEPATLPERSTREEFQNSMLGPLAREVRELKQRVEALTRKEAQPAPSAPALSAPWAPAAEAAPEAEPARTFAREELDEIKKFLYSAVSGKEKAPKLVTFPSADSPLLAPAREAAPAPLETQQQGLVLSAGERLLEQLAGELRAEEVGPEGVELLIEKLRPAAEQGKGVKELRKLLGDALAGSIKCAGSPRMKKNGTKVMALVGPTGVGKTTTIAKLAALHAFNRGLSVAMVTTDNFRVGAVEQLKTYAKIMDLPLEVVANSQELAQVLEKHSDKDLILVDTTGRSPKDGERIEELKGFLECRSGIETYLCLSATTRPRELDEIVTTFGVLPVSRLLFTKLDECESYGCIVNTHLKHGLPLSYLATGQKVPEDIELATARKLTSLVVKESAR